MSEPIYPRTIVLRGTSQRHAGSLYSIVGQFAPTDGNFVKHIALIREAGGFQATSSVRVHHTGPPTVAGELSEASLFATNELNSCEIIADLALSLDDVASIKTWLAGVDKELYVNKPATFQQYSILPHEHWAHAETGRKTHRRFSCVGFVLAAYRSAQIILLDLENLPSVSIEQVEKVFVELLECEQLPPKVKEKLGYKGREDLGIEGEGPWKVVLPGYVFHATARAILENPRPTPLRPISAAYAEYPRVGN